MIDLYGRAYIEMQNGAGVFCAVAVSLSVRDTVTCVFRRNVSHRAVKSIFFVERI